MPHPKYLRMSRKQRGLFIVVEGLDKAGKSTQCSRLAENIQKMGKEVQSMRFPDRTTPIGKMIDNYLKGSSEVDDHAIHLLFSANRWEAAATIESLLASGITIIVDRYYWSGVVYTAAKRNPSLTRAWSRNCDVGLPSPDVCFFLNISAEAARQRGGGYGEERYEKEEFQAAVRSNFEMLFLFEGWERVRRIDAGREVDVVETEMSVYVEALYEKLENGTLGDVGKVPSNETLERNNKDKESIKT